MSPAAVMECVICAGEPEASERLSEGHVAVRFGDAYRFTVLLNGEDVSRDCIEALADREGWALLVGPPKEVCPGGDHPVVHREHGDVQIQSRPVARSTRVHDL